MGTLLLLLVGGVIYCIDADVGACWLTSLTYDIVKKILRL